MWYKPAVTRLGSRKSRKRPMTRNQQQRMATIMDWVRKRNKKRRATTTAQQAALATNDYKLQTFKQELEPRVREVPNKTVDCR